MGRGGGTYSAETHVVQKQLNRGMDTTAKTNAPTKRKQNRYVFQNFLERLTTINIDVTHRVNRGSDTFGLEEKGSYFLARLTEVQTLNKTQDFVDFAADLRPYIQSLPMILHYLPDIINTIVFHLEREKSTAIGSILDVTAVLARDMRQEMFPYFSRLTKILTDLMDPRNSERLEVVFTCLCYLIKFLARQLVDVIGEVYDSVFRSLLSHTKPYVRKFAAESLSFLIRKVRKKDQRLTLHTLMSLDEKDMQDSKYASGELRDGLGMLLFEILKGVQSGYHAQAKEWIPLMFRSLSVSAIPPGYSAERRDRNLTHRFLVISAALRRACNFLYISDEDEGAVNRFKANCDLFWEILIKRTNKVLKKLKKANSLDESKSHSSREVLMTELSRLLLIGDVWARHRQGSRLTHPLKIISLLLPALSQARPAHSPHPSPPLAAAGRTLLATLLLSPAKFSEKSEKILEKAVGDALEIPSGSNSADAIKGSLRFIRLLSTKSRLEPPISHTALRFSRAKIQIIKFLDSAAHRLLEIAPDAATVSGNGSENGKSVGDELLITAVFAIKEKDLFCRDGRRDSLLRGVPYNGGVQRDGGGNWEGIGGTGLENLMLTCVKSCGERDLPNFLTSMNAAPLLISTPVHFSKLLTTFVEITRNHLKKAKKRQSRRPSSQSDDASSSNPHLTRAAVCARSTASLLTKAAKTCPEILRDLSKILQSQGNPGIRTVSDVVMQCRQSPGDLGWVCAVRDWVVMGAELGDGWHKTLSEVKGLREVVEDWIANPDAQLRQVGLDVLNSVKHSNALEKTIAKTIHSILDLSRLPSFADERPIIAKFQNLARSLKINFHGSELKEGKEGGESEEKKSSSDLNPTWIRLVTCFYIGCLYFKFSVVWPSVKTGLVNLVSSYPKEAWDVLKHHIERLSEATKFIIPKSQYQLISRNREISPDKDNSSDSKEVSLQDPEDTTKLSNEIVDKKTRKNNLSKKKRAKQTFFRRKPAVDKGKVAAEEFRSFLLDFDQNQPTADRLGNDLVSCYMRKTKGIDGHFIRAPAGFCEVRQWTDLDTVDRSLWETLTLPLSRKIFRMDKSRVKWLSSLFLRFLTDQHDKIYLEEPIMIQSRTHDKRRGGGEGSSIGLTVRDGARGLCSKKIEIILEVFKKVMGNPIDTIGEMKAVFLKLVQKRHPKTQALGLECYCAFKPVGILPYKKQLMRLIDDRTMRAEMATFSLARELGHIQKIHRKDVVSMVCRILFPKLLRRKIQGSTASMKSRRSALFAYLGSMQPSELPFLVQLIAGPFQPLMPNLHTPRNRDSGGTGEAVECVGMEMEGHPVREEVGLAGSGLRAPKISRGVLQRVIFGESKVWKGSQPMQIGFLSMIGPLMREMRVLLETFSSDFLTATIALFQDNAKNMSTVEEEVDDDEPEESEVVVVTSGDKLKSRVRRLAIQRFSQIISMYPNAPFGPQVEAFLAATRPSLLALPLSCRNGGCPSLLTALLTLSFHPVWGRAFSISSNGSILAALRDTEQDMKIETERDSVQDSLTMHLGSPVDLVEILGKVMSGDAEKGRGSGNVYNLAAAEAVLETMHNLLTTDPELFRSRLAVASSRKFHTNQCVGIPRGKNSPPNHTHALRVTDETLIETSAKLSRYFSRNATKVLTSLTFVIQNTWLSGESRDSSRKGRDSSGGQAIITHALKAKGLSIVLKVAQRFGASPGVSDRVLAVLLPLLERAVSPLKRRGGGGFTSSAATTALEALRVVEAATCQATEPLKSGETAGRLLRIVNAGEGRAILSQIIAQVGKREEFKWLSGVAEVLVGMNSVCKTFKKGLSHGTLLEKGDRDLDQTMDAYGNLPDILSKLPEICGYSGINIEKSLRFLVYQLLYDLAAADRALRAVATGAMDRILSLIEQKDIQNKTKGIGEDSWNEIENRVIGINLLAGLRRGIRHPEEGARSAFLRVLGKISRKFPKTSGKPYVVLINEDNPDMDFIELITHIQIHKRARALTRIADLVAECSRNDGILDEKEKKDTTFDEKEKKIDEKEKKIDKKEKKEAKSREGISGLIHLKCITNVLIPLCLRYVQDAKKHGNRKGFHTVVDAAVNAQGKISAALPWNLYRRHIRGLLELAQRQEDVFKIVMRCVILVMDHFPFFDREIEVKEDKECDDMEIEGKLDTTEGETLETDQGGVVRYVDQILIPQLITKMLIGYEESRRDFNRAKVVRIPVAMALTRLLLKAPIDIFDKHFPKLLLKLIEQLRSRRQETRYATYNGLSDIFKLVGPRFLLFAATEMKRSLRRGYTLQVLQHGINVVMQSIAQDPNMHGSGKCDYALGHVLGIVLEDLLGDPAQHREVEAIVSTVREARESKSFNTLELLCSLTHVPSSRKPTNSFGDKKDGGVSEDSKIVLQVSKPFALKSLNTKVYSQTGTGIYLVLHRLGIQARGAWKLEQIKVLRKCYRHVKQGLIKNPSLSPESLLVLVYPLLDLKESPEAHDEKEEGTKGEEKEREKSAREKEREAEREREKRYLEAKARGIIRKGKQEALEVTISGKLRQTRGAARKTGGHELPATFASELLLHAINKMPGVKGLDHMLNPLIDRLALLCGSPDKGGATSVMLQAHVLEVLTALFKAYPHLDSVAKHVVVFSGYLFRHMRAGNEEILSKSFKGVAAIIRHCRVFRPTKEQGGVLMSYVIQHLSTDGRQGMALRLLKSIVVKRLVLGEVYDAMKTVGNLLIRSRDPAVRRQCSEVSLAFLVDYPMGEKRITSHIHFLVNNLSYPKADGRKSVLELLNQIILKFPNEVLMKLSNLLFLALTLRLANDPDPTCRGMVSELLVNLFQCLTTKNSQRSRKSSQRSGPLGVFFGNTKKWLQDTEGKKKSLQLAGVQVAGILARAVGSGFQAYAGDIIPLLIDTAVHAFERNSKERNADTNTQTNSSIDENGDSEAWNLAHHTVVALTRALKASPRHTAKSALKSSGIPLATIAANGLRFPHVWVRTACARLLGQCLAVRSEAVDEKSTDWIRETALSCCAGFVTDELITTTLGEQLAKNILFLATDQPDSDIIQAIAKRLGGIARKSKPKGISAMNLVSISGEEKEPGWIIRRRSIIKVFGALVAKLEAERSIPLLSIILRPMIMATEDTPSSKNDNAPLKQLAQQVLDLIQKKVGDDHFATAYTQVRGEIMGKRAERAKRRKLEVVQDPQGAARRKRQRTQKKIVAQKRQKAVRKAIRSGELPVARKRCQGRQKKRRV